MRRVDLAELFLAVEVLGVLRAVSLGGGLGDRAGDLRALAVPQKLELLAQHGRAFRRDVP